MLFFKQLVHEWGWLLGLIPLFAWYITHTKLVVNLAKDRINMNQTFWAACGVMIGGLIAIACCVAAIGYVIKPPTPYYVNVAPQGTPLTPNQPYYPVVTPDYVPATPNKDPNSEWVWVPQLRRWVNTRTGQLGSKDLGAKDDAMRGNADDVGMKGSKVEIKQAPKKEIEAKK